MSKLEHSSTPTTSNIDNTSHFLRIKEKLMENEALLRETQKIAQLGTYVMDINNGTWESSEILDDILGISGPDERNYETWVSTLHPDFRETMADYFTKEVLGKKQPFNKIYMIRKLHSGEDRWVHGLGRLEFDENDLPVRMIGTIQDITEMRNAQLERDHIKGQLVQAQKMEAIGRLAGGIAHDFNNMLNVIIGYSELILMKRKDDDVIGNDLEQINNAAKRSADLTKQLLAFSRKQVIEPQRVNFNDIIKTNKKMIGRLIGENIGFETVLKEDLYDVLMDPSQIDQILTNLAVNAKDAIKDHGTITIETENVCLDADYNDSIIDYTPGEYALIVFSDNGRGMDSATVDQIFEPFYTTKSKGIGTGLGLSTVYGIVKQNKGAIHVYSEIDLGTTFKIYFPKYSGDKVVKKKVEKETNRNGNESILIVEDEKQILELASNILQRFGYTVFKADTPEKALKIASKEDVKLDLLLSDVIMPQMNGKVLADQIMALQPGIDILFMSGYTANVIVHHGVLDDGVNFLPKPFTVNSLTAKIRNIFDQ